MTRATCNCSRTPTFFSFPIIWRNTSDRTSGVFCEAMTSGKPVITTEGSFLGLEVAREGIGWLVRDRDPDSVAQAIRRAIERTGTSRRTLRGTHAALQVDVPSRHIRFPASRASPMRKAETRIAVFYPWTGLPALDRGSARRVVPLVRLLAERYDAVRVISPGARIDRCESGNVEYHFQQPSAIERVWLRAAFAVFDGAFHRLFRGRISRARAKTVVALSQRGLPMESGARGPAGRLLVVGSSCSNIRSGKRRCWRVARKRSRKSLLTVHDTLSDLVVGSPWLRAKVRHRELSAARKASAVFCVSRERSAAFRRGGNHRAVRSPRHGHPSRAIGTWFPRVQNCSRWRSARGVGQDCVSLCWQQPARKSGGCGRKFARWRPLWRREEISYSRLRVHASPGEPTSIMSSLSVLLKRPSSIRLYSATDIVLAPLRSGTGTSLKVLEAFVHGKALVATRVGVRGYPVRDGRECVLCDDPQRYPEILISLRANPSRLRALGEAGRSLSGPTTIGSFTGPTLNASTDFWQPPEREIKLPN